MLIQLKINVWNGLPSGVIYYFWEDSINSSEAFKKTVTFGTTFEGYSSKTKK